MPPAMAALLATLAAVLRTLARTLAHAWPANTSTADASPAWPALRPARASATPRSSSAPGSRSRSRPGCRGVLGCGDRGENGKIARHRGVPHNHNGVFR